MNVHEAVAALLRASSGETGVVKLYDDMGKVADYVLVPRAALELLVTATAWKRGLIPGSPVPPPNLHPEQQ